MGLKKIQLTLYSIHHMSLGHILLLKAHAMTPSTCGLYQNSLEIIEDEVFGVSNSHLVYIYIYKEYCIECFMYQYFLVK